MRQTDQLRLRVQDFSERLESSQRHHTRFIFVIICCSTEVAAIESRHRSTGRDEMSEGLTFREEAID